MGVQCALRATITKVIGCWGLGTCRPKVSTNRLGEGLQQHPTAKIVQTKRGRKKQSAAANMCKCT